MNILLWNVDQHQKMLRVSTKEDYDKLKSYLDKNEIDYDSDESNTFAFDTKDYEKANQDFNFILT